MQYSVVKFIAYSHRRCSTCFGQHYAHHQELFQTAVAASGFRINAEVDVFPAVVCLLVAIMMGVMLPETC
jgi:ATP phosphoribosyltransferase regulatory subunit HisZ